MAATLSTDAPLKRRSPEETDAAIRSAAYAALEKYAAKQVDRELLRGGESVKIALDVSGHVGGRWFNESMQGLLQIGADQTSAKSSAPDTTHLVAYLLEQLGPKKRLQLLASLPLSFAESKALPEVAEPTLSAAATLLGKLRSSQIGTRKGNVTFQLASK